MCIFRYVCVWMYVCMYICMRVCMYVYMYVWMYVCMYVYMYVSMHALWCMFVVIVIGWCLAECLGCGGKMNVVVYHTKRVSQLLILIKSEIALKSIGPHFNNISHWLKPKNWQKFFRPHFAKIFTSYCPPMGPKFRFSKKVFQTTFFTHKTFFTTFHID